MFSACPARSQSALSILVCGGAWRQKHPDGPAPSDIHHHAPTTTYPVASLSCFTWDSRQFFIFKSSFFRIYQIISTTALRLSTGPKVYRNHVIVTPPTTTTPEIPLSGFLVPAERSTSSAECGLRK
ncbi:hypothetical protein BDQ17DRAFT_1419669 [Cyathus striatus]|nr:hypothetical protein BDQ17DRAFT_1419669 [Cyathus striatus]